MTLQLKRKRKRNPKSIPTLIFPSYTHQDPFQTLHNSILSISESLPSLMPSFILVFLHFTIQSSEAKYFQYHIELTSKFNHLPFISYCLLYFITLLFYLHVFIISTTAKKKKKRKRNRKRKNQVPTFMCILALPGQPVPLGM